MIFSRKFRLLAPATAAVDPSTTGGKPDDKTLLDDKGAFSGKTPPADGKKPDDNTPKKVKVQITADSFIETDEASATALQALISMNQQLAAQVQQAGFRKLDDTKPDDKSKKPYDYATELFTNPDEAIKRLRAEIKSEVKDEMTAQYNAVETQKEFWTSFYADNDDLKSEKLIVQAVLNRDMSKLKDLSIPEAAKKLAEATKKELMRLKGGTSDADDSRQLEGGSNKNPVPPKNKSDDDKVLSLSDIVRKRQAARHKAQFSKE